MLVIIVFFVYNMQNYKKYRLHYKKNVCFQDFNNEKVLPIEKKYYFCVILFEII